ncbi:hypothetical protein, partial [uncultured Alistipes sp.]|uniref:hypothetical protein n=1 Tax=uncultured Alistipes sp. TaxID=538949 RepID=UPI0025982AF3
AFCRPKSGKEHQSKTAIGTFCGKKVQNTRDIVAAFFVLLMPKVSIKSNYLIDRYGKSQGNDLSTLKAVSFAFHFDLSKTL